MTFMIIKLLLYLLYLILSTYVESIRIKNSWGIKKNINKFITFLIGIFGPVLILIFFDMNLFKIIVFLISCIMIRGILYDPFLNYFRGLKIDYQSSTTNSKVDKFETFLKWDFWKQRRTYLYTLLSILLVYYTIRLIS